MRRGWVRWAGVFAAFGCALAPASCELVGGVPFGDVRPRGDESGGAGATSTSSVDTSVSTSAGTGGAGGAAGCDPAMVQLDAEGCPCTTEGAIRDCYHGQPGPKSACNSPGVQGCQVTLGELVWSACTGGTEPSAETCFNDIDEDCDGDVDEGCHCSDSFDLCKDSGGNLFSPGDHLLAIADVPLGQTFDVYLVSSLALPDVKLQINGSYCAGAGSSSACAAGAGCPGWTALRQTLVAGPPALHTGTNTLKMFVGDPDPPCDGSFTRVVTGTVQITP